MRNKPRGDWSQANSATDDFREAHLMARTTKADLKALLREVYDQDGPRDGRKYNGVVPPEKFAAMTPAEVDVWDFQGRHFMQRIARAIVSV